MQNKKGSLLVASLIILSMILTIGLTLSLVAVKNQRSTMASAKSAQSFQSADNGIEAVLSDIKSGTHPGGRVSEIVGNISGASCVSGRIETLDYTVQFLDSTRNSISCDSSDLITTIDRIKSIGRESTGGEIRAIEVAVTH